MKVYWDPSIFHNFNAQKKTGQTESRFEAYLEEALNRGRQVEDFAPAVSLVEEMLPLLERLAQDPLSRSQAETLAGVLADRAQELEKLLKELPEGPLRETLSEAALFFGVEAEKLRKGFYV